VEDPSLENVGVESGGEGDSRGLSLRRRDECTALLVISGMGHQTTQQGKSCAAGATRWAGGCAAEEEAPGGVAMETEAALAMRAASAGGHAGVVTAEVLRCIKLRRSGYP